MIIFVIEIHVFCLYIIKRFVFTVLGLIFDAELLVLYCMIDHDSAPSTLGCGNDLLDQGKWTCLIQSLTYLAYSSLLSHVIASLLKRWQL